MSSVAAAPSVPSAVAAGRGMLRVVLVAAGALALAGCAAQPGPSGQPGGGRYFDPILGVWASPRVIADGEPIPRGGGGYLVGRPYTVGGRAYQPIANPRGYTVVGTASWYGDAFHGRRTANGEIFDKGSISAAHPTLPLPSYVRVTNLKNGWSMIVRVNDRGPYHGGRVMDVSQRVAETLDFKNAGTARIRVEYIGRAGLGGSDNGRLLATLRTDGSSAHLDGADEGAELANAAPPLAPIVPLVPPPLRPPLVHAALIARGKEDPLTPLMPPPPPDAPSAVLPPPPAAPRRPPFGRGSIVHDRFYRPLPAAAAGRPAVSPPKPAGDVSGPPLVSFSSPSQPPSTRPPRPEARRPRLSPNHDQDQPAVGAEPR